MELFKGPSLQELLKLTIINPVKAADELDKLADRFRQLAQHLRSNVVKDDYKAPGGMQDRIRIAVIGPDGNTKQRVDTEI